MRHFLDTVESHVRSLRTLGVASESYGYLLSSVIMAKLPPDIRLVVSWEVKEEEWQLDPLLKLVEREVKARERSTASSIPVSNTTPKPPPRFPPTSAFIAGSSSAPSCVYCQDSHTSLSCKKVVGAEPRRAIVKSAGRCFVCLRKNHLGRNCRSDSRCHNCQGRHHMSICFR